jgi:hypothetical protein
MKTTLTLLTGFVAAAVIAGASPASADGLDCDNSYITRSFVENRLTIDKNINPQKPYWSAMPTVSVFGDGEYTICACDPVVGAGSLFFHDKKTGAVEIGEAGWLSKADSRDILGQLGFEATLDGEPMATLSSGIQKWENRLNGDLTGFRYQAPNPPEDYEGTGCDWYFENREPTSVREAGESCWVNTFGVDLSTLAVGDYVLETLITVPAGDAPNGGDGLELAAEITLHVVDCDE